VSYGRYISYKCREFGFMWALLTPCPEAFGFGDAREEKINYDCAYHSFSCVTVRDEWLDSQESDSERVKECS
jgi:hypothetical protein